MNYSVYSSWHFSRNIPKKDSVLSSSSQRLCVLIEFKQSMMKLVSTRSWFSIAISLTTLCTRLKRSLAWPCTLGCKCCCVSSFERAFIRSITGRSSSELMSLLMLSISLSVSFCMSYITNGLPNFEISPRRFKIITRMRTLMLARST